MMGDNEVARELLEKYTAEMLRNDALRAFLDAARAELANWKESYERSRAECVSIRAELDHAHDIMQRQADKLNVLQGSIAAYQIGKLDAERDTLRAELAARDELLREARGYDGDMRLADASDLRARIDALVKDGE